MKILLLTLLVANSLAFGLTKVSPNSDNLRGSMDFSWFMFDVYKANLWAKEGVEIYSEPFSLELIYKRDFDGKDIISRSISELEGQGLDKKSLKLVEKNINNIFPNINKGDGILANYSPKSGVEFFLNREKKLGSITDLKVAKDFLDIWFSKKTSEKKMRKKLLGK